VDFEAFDFRHRRFVDARERDVTLVGRPPIASVAVHLFLGDELGHAETHEPAAFSCDRAFGAGGELDDVEVLVAHEAHEIRVWRETRVGFVRVGTREAAHGLGRLAGEVVDVQIAVERDEQVAIVGREAVLDDSRIRRSALPFAASFLFHGQRAVGAGQRAGVDEQPVARHADVEGPEVEPVIFIVAGAQISDELAVGRNLHSAKRGPGQIRRGKQALEEEFPSHRRRRQGYQQSHRQCAKARKKHGARRGRA
jgi:hypothetical protein